LISVTDIRALLDRYLDGSIGRDEFARAFLAFYTDAEDMKDQAAFALSCDIHFPLADAMVGLITEQKLREILSALPPSVDVHVEDNYRAERAPVAASSNESSSEPVFQYA
jgi:hypothetical protein